MMLTLCCFGLSLAAIPLVLTLGNLPRFCVNLKTGSGEGDAPETLPGRSLEVSVLIPARNEARGIESCVNHALSSQGVKIEIIVLDDHSNDGTDLIVQRLSSKNADVKLFRSKPLAEGWNGKQHACQQLSQLARYDQLLFIDADVRLNPRGIQSLLAYKHLRRVDLLSVFPRQEMQTWIEKLIIPMMHLILLGYLPFSRMRQTNKPEYAAGCGQLFFTDKAAYRAAGGHQAIKASRHDGLKLPRTYRRAGLTTDVIDGTTTATCRMYRNSAEVFRGVLKNADEGLATPKLIGVFSVLLLGSSVLPAVLLAISIPQVNHLVIGLSTLALLLSHLPRLLLTIRFGHSHLGILFHLPAVTLFVALQWIALIGRLFGFSVQWRGRS